MATQYRIKTSETVTAPDNIDEMSQYIKRMMLEQHVKTIFKTNHVLEEIFGLGRVPALDTAGRPLMQKLWNMVNTTWKELLNEGFAVSDKKGRYRIKQEQDVFQPKPSVGDAYLLLNSGRSTGYEDLEEQLQRDNYSARSLWYVDRRTPPYMGDI